MTYRRIRKVHQRFEQQFMVRKPRINYIRMVMDQLIYGCFIRFLQKNIFVELKNDGKLYLKN